MAESYPEPLSIKDLNLQIIWCCIKAQSIWKLNWLHTFLTSAFTAQNSFLVGIVSSYEMTLHLPSEHFRDTNSFKLIILLWDKRCCDPHFIGMEIEAMKSHIFWTWERKESLQETAIKLTSPSTRLVLSTFIKPNPSKRCSQEEKGFHPDNPPASFLCWSYRTTSWFCTHTICKTPNCSARSTYVPMLKSISCQLEPACYCYYSSVYATSSQELSGLFYL